MKNQIAKFVDAKVEGETTRSAVAGGAVILKEWFGKPKETKIKK